MILVNKIMLVLSAHNIGKYINKKSNNDQIIWLFVPPCGHGTKIEDKNGIPSIYEQKYV